MEINFECKECGSIFDCDVGTVSVSEDSFRPGLAKLLLPLLAIRSALGPVIEKRVVVSKEVPDCFGMNQKGASRAGSIPT